MFSVTQLEKLKSGMQNYVHISEYLDNSDLAVTLLAGVSNRCVFHAAINKSIFVCVSHLLYIHILTYIDFVCK